jgi:hypothetical protein
MWGGAMGKFWRWLCNAVWVAVRPHFWLMNYPHSAALTAWINERLDAGEAPVRLDEYTVRFGGRVLWVRNYPYAYGRIYEGNAPRLLPSRRTIYRLAQAIDPLSPDEKMRDFLARESAP